MNVFVTGASGFIGSVLVEHLSKQNTSLHCLVHKSTFEFQAPNIKICHGNIEDFDWNYLEEYKIEVLYHLARMSGKTKRERYEAATFNAKANLRLLDFLRNMKNPPRMIFGSGTLVYGNNGNNRVDEFSSINPISYQREYFKAEEPILQSLRDNDIPIIIVRPPWIYGAGSWFKWLYWKHILQNSSIPLYGNGRNYMSLIHIEDCAGLIHHLAENGEVGNIYNIIAHESITQNEFLNLLAEFTGLPIKKYPAAYLRFRLNRSAREALTFSLRSTSKYKNLLNEYELKYSKLDTGLKHILDQLKAKSPTKEET